MDIHQYTRNKLYRTLFDCSSVDPMTPTLVEGVGTYSKGRGIPGEAEGILEAIGGSTVSARSHQPTSPDHAHAGRVS